MKIVPEDEGWKEGITRMKIGGKVGPKIHGLALFTIYTTLGVAWAVRVVFG